MLRKYKVKGPERKRLAVTVSEAIGKEVKYLGAPSYAYRIGKYTIDLYGNLEGPDGEEAQEVLEKIADAGFKAENESTENTSAETAENTTESETNEVESITLSMPMLDGDELSRLEQLVASKETLLKKAIGADSLMIGEEGETITFPWFKGDLEKKELTAYTHLVSALWLRAKESKRITAKDKPVENEKYAFRCFLLRLGMIGEEYKESRKVLLKNFTGSSAFKKGDAHEDSIERTH